MQLELLIQNKEQVFVPLVEDRIVWKTHRKDVAGQLSFQLLMDDKLDIALGNAVRLRVMEQDVFYGFIFSIKQDGQSRLSITAYDQMRYLKNKDSYVYENKSASEVVEMIASDFNMQTGSIQDTGYKIASRVEDNTTLLDIIQTALDLTLQNTKQLYVVYDAFGKLSLNNIASMQVPILIDEETGEKFDYATSIDSASYNRVKLIYDSPKLAKREIYIAQDDTNMNEWGVLQYFQKLQKGENGKAKADALLSLYNAKSKSLSISRVFGDVRVRAGCLIPVMLDLSGEKVQNFMLVETCSHSFSNHHHVMDLTLKGGEFIA